MASRLLSSDYHGRQDEIYSLVIYRYSNKFPEPISEAQRIKSYQNPTENFENSVTYTPQIATDERIPENSSIEISELVTQITFENAMGSFGKLSFTVEHDGAEAIQEYLGRDGIMCGDTVEFRYFVEGIEYEIFKGWLFPIQFDHNGTYKLVAYDSLRYLENQTSMVIEDLKRENGKAVNPPVGQFLWDLIERIKKHIKIDFEWDWADDENGSGWVREFGQAIIDACYVAKIGLPETYKQESYRSILEKKINQINIRINPAGSLAETLGIREGRRLFFIRDEFGKALLKEMALHKKNMGEIKYPSFVPMFEEGEIAPNGNIVGTGRKYPVLTDQGGLLDSWLYTIDIDKDTKNAVKISREIPVINGGADIKDKDGNILSKHGEQKVNEYGQKLFTLQHSMFFDPFSVGKWGLLCENHYISYREFEDIKTGD